ncbi:MAG: UvrD-helicase domain-containing protein [Alphaproteobacteria bacterium]|nr:UvrD-helicase domain-containing protein [Alphaproteobacteria bacterium]
MSGPLFENLGEDLGGEPEHLQGLNPPQHAAVTTLEGPLLILAGAGSGKTRVLTRRVAHLLHSGVRPWNILAVTFTNKAAQEMKHRIEALVGPAAQDLQVSTFHSTCVRILRRDIEPLGYSRNFVIYDDDDQIRLLKGVLDELGIAKESLPPRRARSLIDRAKNRMEGPDAVEARRDAEQHPAAARVFRAYEAKLKAADALDFNDLINKVVELFERFPGVLERWQDRFRYLMVDEYQDTNRAQYRLVNLLASKRRNIAVVGDDDQSIYSFRGADIRNILDFEDDFPDAKVVRLEQNYRSTSRILQAAMAVVTNNSDRKDKELWTDAGEGEPIRTIVAPDEEGEGQRVAREIRTLLSDGVRAEDMAIIYRTNARSRVFEQALSEARVPYVLVGARRFYERREVKDLTAYLRLLLNPADDMSFLRVINEPARGIGGRSVDKLRELALAREVPLLEAAREMAGQGGRLGKALERFVALIDSLTAQAEALQPGELVQRVAEESGYLPKLRAEKTTESEDRIRNITELCRDVDTEADSEDPRERLQAFLDRATLTGQDAELPDSGAVTLMTCHLAKGLEYPVVFVAGLTEGSFPLVWGGHVMERELEEERRLMYVAITRAMRRLYLTRAMRRMVYGKGYVPATPSIFLDEIPRALLVPAGGRFAGRPPSKPTKPVGDLRMQAFLAQARARPKSDEPEVTPSEGPVTTRPATQPSDFAVGTRVMHRDFGEGIIRQKRAIPGTLRLVVEFAGRRRRTINPRLEPLEIILS